MTLKCVKHPFIPELLEDGVKRICCYMMYLPCKVSGTYSDNDLDSMTKIDDKDFDNYHFLKDIMKMKYLEKLFKW